MRMEIIRQCKEAKRIVLYRLSSDHSVSVGRGLGERAGGQHNGPIQLIQQHIVVLLLLLHTIGYSTQTSTGVQILEFSFCPVLCKATAAALV